MNATNTSALFMTTAQEDMRPDTTSYGHMAISLTLLSMLLNVRIVQQSLHGDIDAVDVGCKSK